MGFNLEKLFVDVFAPQKGDVVTIMYDLPHKHIQDNPEWMSRRKLAKSWQQQIEKFADKFGISINPITTYQASGMNNGELPEFVFHNGASIHLEEILKCSTILISMPEFSATAPLCKYAEKYDYLRIASMPRSQKLAIVDKGRREIYVCLIKVYSTGRAPCFRDPYNRKQKNN